MHKSLKKVNNSGKNPAKKDISKANIKTLARKQHFPATDVYNIHVLSIVAIFSVRMRQMSQNPILPNS